MTKPTKKAKKPVAKKKPAAKKAAAKKRPPVKETVGRPTLYRASYAIEAEKLCKLGATDKEMADFFEISEVTLNTWKVKHPKFLLSIKGGKDQADAEVASKLYHRATGYQHPDTHISSYEGTITATPIVKHYPPETVAAIFWLKNRQPAKWRDKQDVEHSGNVTVKMDDTDEKA